MTSSHPSKIWIDKIVRNYSLEKRGKAFGIMIFTLIFTMISFKTILPQTISDSTSVTTQMDMESYLKTATIIFAISLMIILWFVIVYSTRPLRQTSDKANVSLWVFIKDKLSNAAPLEKENDILMDENFDGIRELDNKIPPWFNILFYGTIVFAIVYYLSFHVFNASKLSIDEYKEEMETADLQKEILFRTGKLVTENNVVQLRDAGALQDGKEIFLSKCAVCHGRQGEGLVGPNLTDDYWIHGGNIKDIFKVIKYGVPAKGMVTWQNQLSPLQIQEVASYVLSLHGTNPPNAKPPQGQKYMVTADTTKGPI